MWKHLSSYFENEEESVFDGYIPKDIYEYITNFADDRTILNMLSANKKFNDEEFFKRVLERKYPLLSKFKSGTYKNLFLKMSYHIAKLEEEYGIPYIPVEGYDPVDVYKWSKLTNVYDTAMSYVVQTGDLGLVKSLTDKGDIDYNDAMLEAAKAGHENIVEFMISKGAENFNTGLNAAARAGRVKIVRLMFKYGAGLNLILNTPLIYAAENGHLDIVKLLVEKGATSFKTALVWANRGKHTEVADYLRQFI